MKDKKQILLTEEQIDAKLKEIVPEKKVIHQITFTYEYVIEGEEPIEMTAYIKIIIINNSSNLISKSSLKQILQSQGQEEIPFKYDNNYLVAFITNDGYINAKGPSTITNYAYESDDILMVTIPTSDVGTFNYGNFLNEDTTSDYVDTII